MKRNNLSSVLQWNLARIAHEIPYVVEKEHFDPYYAPLLLFSLEKWKEFKRILYSKNSRCHLNINQIKEAFIARGHNISEVAGNRFIVQVNSRRFLVESELPTN